MRRMIIGVAVFGSLSLLACGGGGGGGNDGGTTSDGGGGNTNPNACTGSETAATAAQVLAIVKDNSNHACMSCHADATKAGGGNVVLDTEAALKANVGKKTMTNYAATDVSVVVANHPETSTLYLKTLAGQTQPISAVLKSPAGQEMGHPMPQGGQALSDAELATVKGWICAGAQ